MMYLYEITFDTSTVLALAEDYNQLFSMLYDLDHKYKSEGRYNLYYHWDENTKDKCNIKVVNTSKPCIVSAVAH